MDQVGIREVKIVNILKNPAAAAAAIALWFEISFETTKTLIFFPPGGTSVKHRAFIFIIRSQSSCQIRVVEVYMCVHYRQ